jgi:Gas vesicle synthesis protein GvpO
MAERRRTRGAADEAEPAGRRRPARRREREPVDRDEPETVDAAEPELADDAELADGPAGANGRKRGSVRAERGPEVALTAKQAARAALRQIMELTAKPAEGITDVAQTEDGWAVGVEVVEDRRIPSSADILATYQATIGTEGELMSYRRLTRYMRGRGDTGEGS